MRSFPKRIPTGIPAFIAAASLLTGCFGSERPSSPHEETDDTISLNVRMGVGGVNSLAKSSAITLDKLVLVLTSSANDTIRDTITSLTSPDLNPVSTTGQNISKSYTLKAFRSWKIVATTRDTRDSVVHHDSATIPALYAGDVAAVNLSLTSRFSMYEAKFLSLPTVIESATPSQPSDSLHVTRLVLKVDGVIVRDSTADPGPYFAGLTPHTLAFDYVHSGTKSVVNSGTSQNLYGIHFPTADTGYAVGKGGVALRTINGGATWSALSMPNTKMMRGVFFLTGKTGWIVGDSTLLRTTNAGVSWATPDSMWPVLPGGMNGQFKTVHFTSATDGVVGTGATNGGGSGAASKTADGGGYWVYKTGTSSIYSMRMASSTKGWYVGNQGPSPTPSSNIRVTVDGGETWNSQTSPTTKSLKGVYPLNVNLVYAVGDTGTIVRTTNGGTTWTLQTSGSTRNLKSVHFVDAAVGYAVGDSGTILSTVDSGVTWTLEPGPTPVNLNAITFFGAKGYAVGDNGTLFILSGPRLVEMSVYGPMGTWNVANPLYKGSKYVNSIPGVDGSVPLILQWVGPSTGTGSIDATLGKVGKITINALLPGTSP